tara:strand:+ start:898 stop:1737 length:840 start_codon:yes stop_codon:yes gene_type:complete
MAELEIEVLEKLKRNIVQNLATINLRLRELQSVFTCKTCKIDFSSQTLYNRHIKSKEHSIMLGWESKRCHNCNRFFWGDPEYNVAFEDHLRHQGTGSKFSLSECYQSRTCKKCNEPFDNMYLKAKHVCPEDHCHLLSTPPKPVHVEPEPEEDKRKKTGNLYDLEKTKVSVQNFKNWYFDLHIDSKTLPEEYKNDMAESMNVLRDGLDMYPDMWLEQLGDGWTLCGYGGSAHLLVTNKDNLIYTIELAEDEEAYVEEDYEYPSDSDATRSSSEDYEYPED